MKKGIIFSCFDLFHAGHVVLLEECKKNCDYLVVCLQSDPTLDRPDKNKPVQDLYERYIQLKGCKYVDEIIPYSTERDVVNILKTNNIDVRFLGTDYKGRDFTGSELDIEIMYFDRSHDYSSSELRKRIKDT